MSTPTQADPKHPEQAGSTEQDFALEMHQFWEKYRRMIFIACGVLVVAVAGYHLGQELRASREQGARDAYAAAVGSPAKLTAFANEYSSHSLAGVALLQAGDASYLANDFAAAGASYQKAASQLQNGLLRSRARLGSAMCKLGAGDQAGAESDFKAVGADTSLEKAIRAEATYHLATLLKGAGRTTELRPLLDEIAVLDTGVWAQRANEMKASLLMNESAPAAVLKP